MQRVNFEFYNIQSHEHTKFWLGPGMNFILADDNNVGKSTIFSVLSLAVRLPNVNNSELLGMLRAGTQQGYAYFTYENYRTILWLVRDDTNKVRAFFEIGDTSNAPTVRALSAPDHLLHALSLMRGPDGEAMNINSADSVQLIVTDSPQNDKVLSKVLVDEDVERIKRNCEQLSRQVLQDAKIVQAREQDSSKLLESLEYNEAVDFFFEEKETLEAVVAVVDGLEGKCDLHSCPALPITVADLEEVRTAYEAATILRSLRESLVLGELPSISADDIDEVRDILSVLGQLQKADLSAYKQHTDLSLDKLAAMKSTMTTISKLIRARSALESIRSARNRDEVLIKELARLKEELARKTVIVQCPVKGEVFYGETCIPTGN